MHQVVPMNSECLIFDSSDRKTINGVPVGALSPNRPKIIGSEEGNRININRIVEHFHSEEGKAPRCGYSGGLSDGFNVVDGNPQNFLITNLEPVDTEHLSTFAFLPKAAITKVFRREQYDIEVELFGRPIFLAELALEELEIPQIPEELGLGYVEAQLLWTWNSLTKEKLLKGLTSLKAINRQNGITVELTNRDVLNFVLKSLQLDISPTGE